MLEVIKTEKVNGLRKKKLGLILNGENLSTLKFPQDPQVIEHELGFQVTSFNLDINNKIKELTPKEFPEIVQLDLFWRWSDGFRYYIDIRFSKKETTDKDETGEPNLTFKIYADLHYWKRKYSFTEFKEGFYRNLHSISENASFSFIEPENKSTQNLNIELSIFHKFSTSPIVEEITQYEDVLLECQRQTISELEKEHSENIITTSFTFPKELKVSCEQYLLYFAQFLHDLGINATSNLKEEAGKVLFSVTPTDDIEALDKIREALAIYLSLFSNPITHSTGDRTVDMVLSGARANAKHLESQLELAIAKLQFKEATLELKDATIEQNQFALQQRDDTIKELKEILSRGNIFEESLESVEINGEVIDATSLYRFSREDDIEVEAKPILDENNEETRIGLVKFHEVTKLKEYGVSFDLAKAIRDLINYFKRNKDK